MNFKIRGISVIASDSEAIQKTGNNIVNGLLRKNSQGQSLNGNSFWCNSCPKCAFVYAILRPFIGDFEVLQIFGKELYEDKTLENLFLELLGIQGIKPFECVGEAEEVIYAMNKSLNNLKEEGKTIPYILSIFEKEVKSKYDEQFFTDLEKKLFKVYNDESLIPEKFRTLV